MTFSAFYLWQCIVSGLRYIPVTFKLSFYPIIMGIAGGTAIALARVFKAPVLGKLFAISVPFYSGLPVMVALLLFNLVYLTCFKPVPNGALIVAYITLGLNRIAIMSESIRGAFLSIPKGQYEACASCGLTAAQTLFRIIIPQAIPVAIPSLANNIVGSIKNTAIVLVVGIVDVLNGALLPCGDTYSYVEGYVAAALIYWAIIALVEQALRLLETFYARYRAGGAQA